MSTPGWRRIGALCAVTVLAGACASINPTVGTNTPQKTSQESARVFHDTIGMSGRISVRYQQNGKDEAVHGNFTWSQTPDLTNIVLASPLGQTLAIIDVSPTSSKLTQSGKPARVAANVDALAAEALGWPLPVSGLRTWLQGFAFDAGGKPFTATADTTGAAAVTTPDGWRIDYPNWQSDEAASSQDRPKRIDLERTTAQAGNVSLRIVIDTWQVR